VPAADLLLSASSVGSRDRTKTSQFRSLPHEVVREHVGSWSLLDELEDKVPEASGDQSGQIPRAHGRAIYESPIWARNY
jgi:hypothetical protein